MLNDSPQVLKMLSHTLFLPGFPGADVQCMDGKLRVVASIALEARNIGHSGQSAKAVGALMSGLI